MYRKEASFRVCTTHSFSFFHSVISILMSVMVQVLGLLVESS